MESSLGRLQQEYHALETIASRFAVSLCEQIEYVLAENSIPLGVRTDHRVKSWNSIAEKLDRKKVELARVADLDDLIGLRLMLLFRRDVEKTCDLLCGAFKVLEREDTRERLKEDQFGYQSLHLIIAQPETWAQIPSMREFVGLKAEIQVRTLAQHIWAAASQLLQYKHEAGVPQPVRRSIHRVSALLETVDLEFERVLQDRDDYLMSATELSEDEPLNVDLLAQILDRTFPAANKEPPEEYGELLEDLMHFEVLTVQSLSDILASTLEAVLAADATELGKARARGYIGTSKERSDRGVYFTHSGLTRKALAEHCGHECWLNYAKEKLGTAVDCEGDKPPNRSVDSEKE